MDSFDSRILAFFNHFAQHSFRFDAFVSLLSNNGLVKGGVIMAIIWWLWFSDNETEPDRRERLLATLASATFAIFAGRLLALTLPFRARPLNNPELHFNLPFTIERGVMDTWSAFPSDHAILFLTLAAGIVFVSRRFGIFAVAYTLLVICLPRIYLGLHYPTDIVAGGLLGIGIAWLGQRQAICHLLAIPANSWLQTHPPSFYMGMFLFTYQVADMFDSVRVLGRFFIKFVLHIG